MKSRVFAFLYGAICYVVFLGSFLYAIGFIGNFGVEADERVAQVRVNEHICCRARELIARDVLPA